MKTIKRVYVLLAILFCSNSFLQAQASFSYGPELGLSVSQLWHWNTQKLKTGEKIESDSPLLGPSIGFYGQLAFKSGLFIQGTIGYQFTGTKSYSKREESIPRITNHTILFYYSTEYRKKNSLHKIEMPLSIGYVFNNTHLKPAIYIGGSFNWLLKGTYSSKSKYWRSEPLRNESYEESINLLDKKLYHPLKPLSFQLLLGVSIYASSNLKLSFNANYGKPFEYVPNEIDPLSCIYTFGTISNSEVGLSVTYLINSTNTNE